MSHVKHVITLQSVTREKVIRLLGITELDYGNYLMEQANAYLEEQLGGLEMGKELAVNALFWKWWKNHWHDIDMDFLDACKHMSIKERNIYYRMVHDRSAFDYTPQRAILIDALKNKEYPKTIKHQL
jgi:hypothetical protein